MRPTVPLVALALLAGALLSGCAGPDVRSEQRSLLETDRAWSAAIGAGDLERMFTFWANEAVIHPVEGPPVRGKAAIREAVTRDRARGVSLSTRPEEAVIPSTPGVGYTVGTYEFVESREDGAKARRPGRYLCLWRLNTSGRWECVVEFLAPRLGDDAP